MTQYFFLGSLLPPLEFGTVPEMSYKELVVYLEANLSKEDQKKLQVLRRLIDLYYLRSFWKEEKIGEKGNFNENELEEALLTRTGFPDYVYNFLEKYENTDERLKHFSELLAVFFDEEISKNDGFLRKFLQLERESRLVMMAFRAKRYNRDLINELQFEDPNDEIVAEIISQKDAPSFEPPDKYIELKSIFQEYGEDPIKLEQHFLKWKFEKIQEMQGVELFSIDSLLGYVARLFFVEKWNELNQEQGLKILDSLLKEAK